VRIEIVTTHCCASPDFFLPPSPFIQPLLLGMGLPEFLLGDGVSSSSSPFLAAARGFTGEMSGGKAPGYP
jgi:hypothetical protein